jgi:hypothetical protein
MTPNNLPNQLNVMPTRRVIEPASPVHRDLVFEWGGLSNGGARNAVNEDCYFLGRFDRSLEPILTNLQRGSPPAGTTEGYVAIVADGGGRPSVKSRASQCRDHPGAGAGNPDDHAHYEKPWSPR